MSAHLTPDQQTQALSEWGGTGSFRCCACGSESTVLVGTVPTRYRLEMAVCGPCDRKMQQSPRYRHEAHQRAETAAFLSLLQRVADLVGVPLQAMTGAFEQLQASHAPFTVARLEALLGVPPGSVDGALAQVLGAGRLQ